MSVNIVYFQVSNAKKISFRACIRAISEEIKKRKHLKKDKKIGNIVTFQLLALKEEVRYLSLARAYFRRVPYKSVERSVSLQKRVDADLLLRTIKHHVGGWSEKYHTLEMVKAWLDS